MPGRDYRELVRNIEEAALYFTGHPKAANRVEADREGNKADNKPNPARGEHPNDPKIEHPGCDSKRGDPAASNAFDNKGEQRIRHKDRALYNKGTDENPSVEPTFGIDPEEWVLGLSGEDDRDG